MDNPIKLTKSYPNAWVILRFNAVINMYGDSCVNEMCDSSCVKKMWDNSCVLETYRDGSEFF